MTEDNTPETEGSQEGNDSAEESPVIKDLRKQLRDMQRELKGAPSRADIEAELRASLAREKAIETALVGLKLPAGLTETVEGKLGDAEVTPEKVAEALKAIGFELSDSEDSGSDEDDVAQPKADDLAGVTSLGNQVANAATGGQKDNVTDRINAAQTRAELDAIMVEAGLSQ